METTVREYRRTEVPQVEVRYNYSTPSMSRRGGTRLHPVKDGTLPMGEQLCHIRTRDRAGNKLRDVVNPLTGYVQYVESPLESPVNGGPGVSGSHTVETLRGTAFALDYKGRKVYRGEYEDGQAVVFRTVEDGDNPLAVTRVRRPTKPTKKGRSVKASGVPAHVPGGTGRNGGITRRDCIAMINAMAKGREVTITEKMIKDARLLIEKQRAAAAKHLGKQG